MTVTGHANRAAPPAPAGGWGVAWIAVAAGVLPLAGVHVALALSIAAADIPACIPYFSGCTSVSAAGRNPPASLVFRSATGPAAVFMLLYWLLARVWLTQLGDGASRRTRALPWLGAFASVFLVAYSNALGHIGDIYAIARRIGVVCFFSATFFAQLLFTSRIVHLRDTGRLVLPAWIPGLKLGLCIAMLAIGLVSIPIDAFVTTSRVAERIAEWNFALLMVLYFPVTAAAWRASGFAVRFTLR